MKKIILSVALFSASFAMTAQVGIGTTTPEGVLDVVSTNSGFFLPRVANTGAVTSPVNGMIIYDLSSNCLKAYSAGEWSECFGKSAASDLAVASDVILAQIGNEADDPDAINSVVTIADLNAIVLPPITGIQSTKETSYQNYIDANPALFSSPATQAEVQAMVDAIALSDFVLAQIGNEADDPDATNSVVTIANLNAIVPTVTGIQSTKETSYQNYIDGNPALFSSPATQAEVQAMVDAISPTEVVSPTGKIWMDRNLGASRVATSRTDTEAYGDLYQWGRNSDGHQLRNSPIAAGPVASGSEGSNFITVDASPNDWLSTPNDTRWNGASKGTHDPCPAGFRVPTVTELDAERLEFSTNNAAGAFNSVLKLTVTGNRNRGFIDSDDLVGYYWSSTVDGTNARFLALTISNAVVSASVRASGFSVRCIKEE